jgi:hypothetical protein
MKSICLVTSFLFSFIAFAATRPKTCETPSCLKGAIEVALATSNVQELVGHFSDDASLGVCESELDEVGPKKAAEFLTNEANPGLVSKSPTTPKWAEEAKADQYHLFLGFGGARIYSITAEKSRGIWKAKWLISCDENQARSDPQWAPWFKSSAGPAKR